MWELFYTSFKFLNIIRYIFNVWRETVEDLNAHIVYSPLVCSKINYGKIKSIELSCTFSTILWIQIKKMFVFNYKEH
jgi:hypothetical protein